MFNGDETLKPAEELRALLVDAGITSDTHLVTHCTIGNRASRAWFALEYLLDYARGERVRRLMGRMGERSGEPIEP
jgi:3-mercaptopyruvate sulfurtransferase SseA